ncbi:MAG: patatin-like phospholipase family protein [Candidatus Doudnabacteria bacterium]|nr:patatin-like phospholipase family protein [Candidatus Doudnabacteria bacterium]
MKSSIIYDGGGMQGSYMAGILAEFQDRGIKAETWGLHVGTSAGAFCAAYFISGQLEEGLRIWEKHLTKGFISWKNFHPYYDLSYLKRIITEIEPLNLLKLSKSKSQLIVSLTKPGSNRTNYVNLTKVKNPIDVLLACCSAPFLSEPMSLNGKIFYDGGFTAQPPIGYPGLKKIKNKTVLLTYPRGFRLKEWAWQAASLILLTQPKLKAMVAKTARFGNASLNTIERDKNYTVIQPDLILPGGWLNINPKLMSKNVRLGRKAAKKFIIDRNL